MEIKISAALSSTGYLVPHCSTHWSLIFICARSVQAFLPKNLRGFLLALPPSHVRFPLLVLWTPTSSLFSAVVNSLTTILTYVCNTEDLSAMPSEKVLKNCNVADVTQIKNRIEIECHPKEKHLTLNIIQGCRSCLVSHSALVSLISNLIIFAINHSSFMAAMDHKGCTVQAPRKLQVPSQVAGRPWRQNTKRK